MHDWKPRMQRAARHFAEQLRGIRTGGVDVGLIQTIRVECQGRSVPINHLAVLKSQGDRILVTPFDRAVVPSVVKAFNEARFERVCPQPGDGERQRPSDQCRAEGRDPPAYQEAGRGSQGRRPVDPPAGTQADRILRPRIVRAVQEATDAAVEEIEQLVKAKATELT